MSRRTRAGFSLAEVMVFCLLLSMLLGGMYLLLVAGLRNVRQSMAYQTAQQQALIAIRTLVSELSNARSDADYLLYDPTPPNNTNVAFLSGFRPYPAGQDSMVHTTSASTVFLSPILWQKWVGYCIAPSAKPEDGQELIRFESPLATPVSFPPGGAIPLPNPQRPTGSTGGASWTGPARKVIARNINSLTFGPGTEAPTSLVVTLAAQAETASDRVTRVNYRVTAWLQN